MQLTLQQYPSRLREMLNRNFDLDIKSNYSLEKSNTFGLNVVSESFYIVKNLKDLKNILWENRAKKITVLGGGSNILFTKFLDGLCLKIDLKGIDIIEENKNNVVINVMAGENWHDFVQWCVNKGFGGIENLSLIPGLVGAAPIQNIGAYGVELKDVFISCNTINIKDQTEKNGVNKGLWVIARTLNMLSLGKVPIDNIKIVASIHGDASFLALNDKVYKNKFGKINSNLELIDKLIANGVEIYVCSQATASRNINQNSINKKIKRAYSGLSVLANYQLRDYIFMPY